MATARDSLAMFSSDSADTDHCIGKRRSRNFFSLINIDCISLNGDGGIHRATSIGSVGYGAFSTDEYDAADGCVGSGSSDEAPVPAHETTCFICLQDFEGTKGKRPVQLRCGHNICLDCDGTLAQADKRKPRRCPVCAKLSSAPHGVNSALVTRLGDKDVLKQRRVCAECGVSTISVFCEDCLLPLCPDCDKTVHTPKPFAKHKRNKTEVAPMNRALLTKCRLHFEEITEWCATCQAVLCPSCVTSAAEGPDGSSTTHVDHEIQRISAVVPSHREALIKLSDECDATEGVVQSALEAVEEGIVRLSAAQTSKDPTVNSVHKTKMDINAHFDDIIEKLQARREELLRQVDVITDHKVTSLKAQEAALSHLLTRSYLAACRGRITALAGSNIAVADSFTALQHHLSNVANTDMSNTAMREPVVDFYIPEFYGPSEIDLSKLSRYGAVGGPRVIEGLSCAIMDVGTSVRLRWDPVLSRGRHVARTIEIQMSVKGSARVGGAEPVIGTIARSDSYELSSDDEDDSTKKLVQFVHEYVNVGETELESTEFVADVSRHANQVVYFRIRIVDRDMNLTGPWSTPCSVKTPRKFGKVLLFRTPFDQGGLMSFIGSAGTPQWVNPILSGELKVTASSFGERMYIAGSGDGGSSMSRAGWLTGPSSAAIAPDFSLGNPPALEQLALLASPSVPSGWTMCTDDVPGSWLCLDIGPDRLMKVSHYCLRNGAAIFQGVSASGNKNDRADGTDPAANLLRRSSSMLSRSTSSFSKFQDGPLPFSFPHSAGVSDKCATLRSWHFQGRVREGGDWVTLSVHTRVDSDLLPDGPHIGSAWQVSSKLGAYRFFRVLQTGRNSLGTDVLSIAGVDLYGTIF